MGTLGTNGLKVLITLKRFDRSVGGWLLERGVWDRPIKHLSTQESFFCFIVKKSDL